MARTKHVKIYTDGACSGNPGPGGYGVVLIYRDKRSELSAGYRKTTNNRMELLAAIRGLEALKERCSVIMYCDSRYVVDGITKGWARGWQARGWRRKDKQPAVNPDLWKRLLELCDRHEVRFRWVRGHDGETENERCDELATAAIEGPDLLVDEKYESNVS